MGKQEKERQKQIEKLKQIDKKQKNQQNKFINNPSWQEQKIQPTKSGEKQQGTFLEGAQKKKESFFGKKPIKEKRKNLSEEERFRQDTKFSIKQESLSERDINKNDTVMESQRERVISIIGVHRYVNLEVQVKRSLIDMIFQQKEESTKEKIMQSLWSIHKLMQKKHISLVFFDTRDVWNIMDCDFQNEHHEIDLDKFNEMRKIAFHIARTKIEEVIFSTAKFESLIMFSHVEFKNLVRLKIREGLFSLEPLTWLDCPNLRVLMISDTFVSNPKPLYKLNFKKLSHLSLHSNKIQQMSFQRINIKKGSTLDVIKVLRTNINQNLSMFKQTIAIQDICQVARCEVARWNMFDTNNKFCLNRIRQVKAGQKLNNARALEWDGGDDSDESSDGFEGHQD